MFFLFVRHDLLIPSTRSNYHRSLINILPARADVISHLDPRILVYMLFHMNESSISLDSVRYLIETRPQFALRHIPLHACAHAILFGRWTAQITDAKKLRSLLKEERRGAKAIGLEGYEAITTGELRGIYLDLQAEAFKVDDENLARIEGLALHVIQPEFARTNLFSLIQSILGHESAKCSSIEKVLMASSPAIFPVHMMGPELLTACIDQAMASCVDFASIQPTFDRRSLRSRPTLTIAWYLLRAYGIDRNIDRKRGSEPLPEYFYGTASVIAWELLDATDYASRHEISENPAFKVISAERKVMGRWVRDVYAEQKRALALIV